MSLYHTSPDTVVVYDLDLYRRAAAMAAHDRRVRLVTLQLELRIGFNTALRLLTRMQMAGRLSGFR